MKPEYTRHHFDIKQCADGWHADFCDHTGRILAKPPEPYSRKYLAVEWARNIATKMLDASIVIHEPAMPSDD